VAEATDLDPIEWRGWLGKKQVDRQPTIQYWARYYEGNHDLPAGPNQHREVFRRFQRLARTNLCLLCAESMVHRTRAIGFRDPGWKSFTEMDPVWRLWQRAKLDARQFGVWRKVYGLGSAYVTVGVDPRRPRTPRVTIEGPQNVIVEHDPADSSRRLAAQRLWHDPIARRWMATLYLPGTRPGQPGLRYHWQTKKQTSNGSISAGLSWKPAMWEERTEPGRSLPEVPVIPFYNGEDTDPYPAFAPGIDVQNRLNLTLLNRLTSERYAAFRQTVLLNYQIEEDPVTGEPIAPWKPGTTQIGMVGPPDNPGDPAVQLVQLQQTDTSQMLRGTEGDMRAFAAVTLTPVYYLPGGDMINLGAETVAALDSGHNAKVSQAIAGHAEGLEETLQLMADVAELGRDLSSSEVTFGRPENFNPAAVGDLFVKLVAAGVPVPMAAEEVGWSPQQVDRLRSELAAQTLRDSLQPPPTPTPAPQQRALPPAPLALPPAAGEPAPAE
jgi:Phage portal protein, SPP1 Gp6-like